METLIITIAVVSILLGLVGLVFAIRELWLNRSYVFRRKRRTYQAVGRHRK